MRISQAQYKATNKYKEKNYKRVPLDVRIEEYDLIKDAATKNNESVNGYIRKAVQDRIIRDNNEQKRLDEIGYIMEEETTPG